MLICLQFLSRPGKLSQDFINFGPVRVAAPLCEVPHYERGYGGVEDRVVVIMVNKNTILKRIKVWWTPPVVRKIWARMPSNFPTIITVKEDTGEGIISWNVERINPNALFPSRV